MKKVLIEVSVETEEAVKELARLEKKLKELKEENFTASDKLGQKYFDELSNEINETTSSITKLKNQITLTSAGLNDKKKDFTSFTDGIADGFKVSSSAVQTLDQHTGGLASEFVRVGKAAKLSGKAMRTALISSGIGLLITGLVLVIENWDKIKEAIGFADNRLQDVIDKHDIILDRTREELDLLKIRGKILEEEGVSTKQNLEDQLEKADQQVELAQKNLDLARKAKDEAIISGGINLTEAEKEKIKIAKKALIERETDLEQFRLDRIILYKKGTEDFRDAEGENEKIWRAGLLARLKAEAEAQEQRRLQRELFAIAERLREQEFTQVESRTGEIEGLSTFDAKKLAVATEGETAMQKMQREFREQYIKDEEEKNQLTIDSIFSTLAIIDNIAFLFAGKSEKAQRKAFNTQKAVDTARALMSTYLGAANALADPKGFPFTFISAASTIVAGLANVKRIQSQQFRGGSTSQGSSPSISGGSAGSLSSSSADSGTDNSFSGVDFSFLGEGAEGTTGSLFGNNDVSGKNSKTYVVSEEMTDQQNIDERISELSGIG